MRSSAYPHLGAPVARAVYRMRSSAGMEASCDAWQPLHASIRNGTDNHISS